MIDALRLLMHRPLRDGDRRRLFVLAVAVMAAAAGLFALLDRGPRSASPAPRPQPTPAPVRSLAATPEATPARPVPQRPSEEGRSAAVASRPGVQRVERAARRFLAGYLPYSYGQHRARAIAGASPALRRRLRGQRPRVPPRERARRARVMLLHADGVGRSRAAVVALVADGARSYTVAVELERARAGWRVTRVGS
jgi:hypothetical protein